MHACVQAVYDAPDPVSCPLPKPWSTKLDVFQRLLLLRVLRPDMLTIAIHSFVKASMGQRFVESPPLDLEACYGDSNPTSPLIFVLSPGSDPMTMLLKFAERLKCQVRWIRVWHGIRRTGARGSQKAGKLISNASTTRGCQLVPVARTGSCTADRF